MRTAPIDRADPVERRDEIVERRQAGDTWPAVALAVGMSQSRVRRLYADAVHPAPRYTPDEAAMLENLRAFLDEARAAGTPTSRRAYGMWPARIASPATVVTRFGSWVRAVNGAMGRRAAQMERASTVGA